MSLNVFVFCVFCFGVVIGGLVVYLFRKSSPLNKTINDLKNEIEDLNTRNIRDKQLYDHENKLLRTEAVVKIGLYKGRAEGYKLAFKREQDNCKLVQDENRKLLSSVSELVTAIGSEPLIQKVFKYKKK